MNRLITPGGMLAMEQRAFAAGLSSLALMERAAALVCEELEQLLGGLQDKRIIFACGSGNNGGDGVAAARLCQARGALSIILLPWGCSTPDARHNLERARALGIPVVDSLDGMLPGDALVDALFGIGLARPLAGEQLALVEGLNALHLTTLSVDIPSGMHALTGAVQSACIQATVTLSFQHLKTGHVLTARPEAIGRLVARGIGLEGFEAGTVFIEAYETAELPALLPKRSRAAHKGSCGRALLYCGSLGMAGAAAMAALGCMRAGAGLTQLVCEPDIMPILQVLAPNATCIPLQQAVASPPRHDVLLAGCGLGQTPAALKTLLRLYDPDRPAVLDADALNMLAVAPFPLGSNTLLTPHAGEAARLLGCSVEEATADLMEAAIQISQRYGAVTLLKSHTSVITDGERVAFNITGSPALAKGGSGDALAGILTGLMAQGMGAFDAARVGALWFGRAAQLAAERHGTLSCLTSEVLGTLGEASKP